MEGGEFSLINRSSIRPKIIIKHLIKHKIGCIAVFKNGMIYDGCLLCLGRNPLRHIKEGRKSGKEYYNTIKKIV